MKDWLRSNEKAVYRIINAGILIGMILLCGEGFLGIGGLDRLHLVTALAVLALCAGLNYTAARGRILCLTGVLVLLVTGAAAAGAENTAAFLEDFLPWLMGGESPEEWRLGYGLLQTGLITGICYLLQVLFEKVPVLKRVFAVLIFLVLAGFMFLGREINHYGAAFWLCFSAIVWMEWMQGRWKKVRSGRGSREAHTLWVMPFLAVYLLLLAAMPVPEKPYDWLWARSIYRQLEETFLTYTQNLKWGSREGFGMTFSGFSEEGELQGDLEEASGLVMRIYLGRNLSGNSSGNYTGNAFGGFGENVYLTGRVYDTFDGRGWKQEWEGYAGEVFLDTAETLYAVRRYNRKYQRDYLREISMVVRYEDFRTGYVFAPLKTWSLTEGNPGEEPDYACEGGSLQWRGQRGYGTEYGLQYFGMNMGQKEFDRFLEGCSGSSGRTVGDGGEAVGNGAGIAGDGGGSAGSGERTVGNSGRDAGNDGETAGNSGRDAGNGGEAVGNGAGTAGDGIGIIEEDRELWAEIQRESGRQNGHRFLLEELADYRNEVYANYLGEIKLSPEVRRYLDEITGDAGTDVAKLRAIERELSSFSYTLTPGELPEQVEDAGGFLDYFLLESRQGYCTYFATAFVLLARAEGIPARYVQGYCVPLSESGEAFVDSSMAHAWPEVYLEGAGWIPFEPTPGYGERRYVSWDMTQPEEEDSAEGSLPEESNFDTGSGLGVKEEAGGADIEEKGSEREEENSEEGEENSEGKDEENEGTGSAFFRRLLGIALPVILAVCVVVFGVDNALSRYRYKRMRLGDKFRKAVFKNLEILSWLGLRRREWETLEELQILSESAGRGGECQGLRFIEDYEKVIYGGEEVREEMLEGALKEREVLLALLKKERKWVYFYCRMGLLLGRYR